VNRKKSKAKRFLQKMGKKNAVPEDSIYFQSAIGGYLPFLSSDTVSFFLPLALLRAITALPLAVDILCLKPCLFVLFRLLGWYVLFMLPTFLGPQKYKNFQFLPIGLLIFSKFQQSI
jgi:hypothetical protein